jgi:hypothetical protein
MVILLGRPRSQRSTKRIVVAAKRSGRHWRQADRDAGICVRHASGLPLVEVEQVDACSVETCQGPATGVAIVPSFPPINSRGA